MPRERQEIFRESRTKEKEKIVVLAFEGNKTELIYFEEFKSSNRFNDELIYLHLLKRPKANTESAPKHVFQKLKKEAKDEFNFNNSDELWMIIDKDSWKEIPEIIELCAMQRNMFVAVSNPCFEFWILLHVKDISKLTDDEKKKLLLNEKKSNRKRYIDCFLSELLDGGYNKNNPRPERYIRSVEYAVQQGLSLDDKRESFPQGLGSHVYKVMKVLLKR